MKGKLTFVAMISVIAAVGASVPLGSAAGGSAKTITALGLGTGITRVDADHSGKPSLGDYEIGFSRYVEPKSGKAMGHGSVVCTQINAAGTEYQCQGVTHFPGGDVATAGLFSVLAQSYSLAVTGGTRAYAGMTGTFTGTWLTKDYSKARAVFSLHA